MYSVVGCRDCEALWVVEGRPDTTHCPRCETRRAFGKLRTFVQTDDPDTAREGRAALLARRQDAGDVFADLDPFGTLGSRVDEADTTDESYLAAAGVDTDEVAAAGRRAERGPHHGANSRVEVVRRGLSELEAPTEDDVVAYATNRGIEGSDAREVLERLVDSGEVIHVDGTYRVL